MMQIEIYIELEEQSGMKAIRSLLFGDFMHLVEMRMALIGSTGAQNRKLNGNKTIAYG